jgi:uncharacterized protein (DUF697 family)
MTKKTEIVPQEKEIDGILKRHSYWAVGAGLIPIPVADIAAVTAIQLDMLKQVCSFYNVDYSEETGKTWITALVTSSLSAFVAKIGSSALKVVPVIGTIAGAASMAVVSGASTYALGKAFANHFEAGGTFGDINKEKIKEIYEEKLKEGKKIAKKLKDKYLKLLETPEGKEKERKIGKRLKELEDMRKKKQITEEEYEKMRQNIIKKAMGEED